MVALTYGHDVDWVRNVIADGGCRLIHRGRTVELIRPSVLPLGDVDENIPDWIRGILRILGVSEALTLASLPPGGHSRH